MAIAERPYGLDETFERIVAELSATNQAFWKRIGCHVDPDRLVGGDAKLVIQAARSVWAEGGMPTVVVLRQRIRRWLNDGKMTARDANVANDLLDAAVEDAPAFDPESIVMELQPVLKRSMEKAALDTAYEIFGKKGDMGSVAEMLTKAKRIGMREQALGTRLTSSTVNYVWEKAQVQKLNTGIDELDAHLGGLRRGTFTLITGATGTGKSMALDHIHAHCISSGMPSALATLELMDDDHHSRIIGNLVNMPYEDPQMYEREKRKAEKRLRVLEQDGLLSFFTCNYFPAEATTVDEVIEWVKAEEQFYGIPIPVIGIDYAMQLTEPKKKARHEEIKTIGNKLRTWAKQERRWVISPHQGTGETMDQKKVKTIGNKDVAEGKGIVRATDLHLTINLRDGGETIMIHVAKNNHGESGGDVGPIPHHFEYGRLCVVHREGWPY